MTVTDGHNIVVSDNSISNVGWIVGMESEATVWTVDAVVERNQGSNMKIGFVAAKGNVPSIVIRDNTQTTYALWCYQTIDIGAANQDVGTVTITNNSLRSMTDGITIEGTKVPSVTIQSNTVQTNGACGVRPGITVTNVASGSIANNTLLSYAPLVIANDSSAYNCGNRSSSTGAFDNPSVCAEACEPSDAGGD